MSNAPGATVDPHTRWGVYATFGLYVLGLATLAAGAAGVADTFLPGLFLWIVAQVAVGLSTLADAFVLGRERVEWGRSRYLYVLGVWVVPPLVVLYIYNRRRRVRAALRERGGGADPGHDDDRPSGDATATDRDGS